MDREIKFRGISIETGDWIYGFYSQKKPFTEIRHYIQKGFTNEWVEVIAGSVGRYTGEKDKNGKDIFEGDIITTIIGFANDREKENGIFDMIITQPVIMIKGCWCVGSEDKHGFLFHYTMDAKRHQTEVLGNVSETPELINSLPKQ